MSGPIPVYGEGDRTYILSSWLDQLFQEQVIKFSGITVTNNAAAVTLATYTVKKRGLFWVTGRVGLGFVSAGRMLTSVIWDPIATGVASQDSFDMKVISSLACRATAVPLGPVMANPEDRFIFTVQMTDADVGSLTADGQLQVGGLSTP